MFSEYIRSIVFFLVFASFVGIILPSGKYKSYINIVIGFVVMFLVFEPISDISGAVESLSRELTPAADTVGADYGDKSQEIVADALKKQLREQTSQFTETLGYELSALDADMDPVTAELRTLSITVSKKDAEISVAPVTLDDDGGNSDIKKIVSDFYQLPEEHIYVTIR